MKTPKLYPFNPKSQKLVFEKKIRALLTFIAFIIYLTSQAQNWPAGIHDPSSIIKDKDKYWIFATGDGIAAKYSYDMVTWLDGPSPFPNGEYPSWIDTYTNNPAGPGSFTGHFWAPDIIYMNGKYYLYYSASVWGTTFSCIGVVVNETLDPEDPNYEWVDQGDIGIYSPRAGFDINAIDAAMMRGPDNRIWMTYGSFNKDGILVTEVDSISGQPIGNTISVANSYTGNGAYGEGEGGSMFYRDGYYYLIYDKGGCCNGIASTYYMVIGRSVSPFGPFTDKDGNPMRVESAPSGGTLFFEHDDSRGLDDRYYGPGHFGLYRENGVDYVSFHYYSPNGYYPSEEANYMGGPTLGHAMLEWGEDGWPTLSMDFLKAGVYSLENENSSKALDLENHNTSSGTITYQYDVNPNQSTQKWRFTPLGTGEYTIQSYADETKYLEAVGTNNDTDIQLTSNYTGTINQKWRVVKDANDQLIIYPSSKDVMMEIPFAQTADAPVTLFVNTNHPCQRWTVSEFLPDTPTLSKLTTSNGTLVPNFDPDIFNYTVYAAKGASSVTLTPTPADNSFTITENGASNGVVDISSGEQTATFDLTTSINTNSTYTITVVPVALKHSYSFESDASDQVGSAHGSLAGSATISNGALILDAEGDYANLDAATIAINTYQSTTLELFVKTGADVGCSMALFMGDINLIWMEGNDYLMTSASNCSDISYSCIQQGDAYPWTTELGVFGPALGENEMHHLVTVIRGESLRFYVDGDELGFIPLDDSRQLSNVSNNHAFLGKSGYFNDPTWLGEIHEFNIYAGQVDAASIRQSADGFLMPAVSSLADMSFEVGSLSPSFDPAIHSYTVSLPAGTASVQPTVITTSTAAIVNGDDPVDVSSGSGTSTIVVTSFDGSSSTTYTVNYSVINNTTIHVEGIIDGTINLGRGKKKGFAEVTVFDNNGSAVPSVTVDGTFIGTFNESISGVTGTDGKVYFATSGEATGSVNIDFCVDNLTHQVFSYDPNNNNLTCASEGGARKSEHVLANSAPFKFYPNPSTNYLTIEIPVFTGSEIISITDLSGIVRGRKNASSTIESLDVSDLSAGIYIISVTGQEYKSQEFMIKH
ncbi:family 43 glycosylhydrolase [Marinoscillum sp. MHG1-6]|uniref:family 43 glycosylhydrolase n=1 Tax=Marinoscillum sp. MHG1-6 TaxID=2959627 RepID=UPI00215797AF|nr:family 43 glycosylhydrolase [Marinoscillum sp. MHG1-6]